MTIAILMMVSILLGGGLSYLIMSYRSKYEGERALRKSAEEAAAASNRILKESKKTHEAVEKYNHDTPIAVGNKLLSGSNNR